jgi:hypothetical protein
MQNKRKMYSGYPLIFGVFTDITFRILLHFMV